MTSLRVNLRDKNNESYRGQLYFKNWTLWYGEDGKLNTHPEPEPIPTDELDDASGAGYFVIAVVLVYGMSIVMLIASHINRKHGKIVEDRQIHKYLREFQIVKERSSQEAYKDLKRKIKEQIKWEKEHNRKQLTKTLSHALLPMIAVTMPTGSLTNLGIADDIVHSRRNSIGQFSCPSSPSSIPRSRSSSVSSMTGVQRPGHGNFLHPDDAEVRSSPRLTRARRKGVVNHYGNHNLHHIPGMDDHHLEKILEESMDSRGSFHRRSSKRSKQSSHSSQTSLPEALKTLVENGFEESQQTCRSVEELDTYEEVGNRYVPNSPDSGLSNHSPETVNTPDIAIDMPDEQQPLYPSTTNTPVNMDYSVPLHENDEDSVWVLNSDFPTDDEDLRDEAYASGHHITDFCLASLPKVHTYVYANHFANGNGNDRFVYNVRKARGTALSPALSPLQDESESEYNSSSDESENDELLHVTCV